MSTSISSPRGTADVLPSESFKWQHIENTLKSVCERFGYAETRTPTFEHTELFQRGVGDATDVVDKEMYTMTDKGGRSITLRPEGTAGVVRSFLQNGVLTGVLPVRAYYIMSCFRYEKPQAGRLREFHQLGIEMFGSPYPDADCEVIRVAKTALNELGIKKVRLELNSIGCPKCRPIYHENLFNYFKSYENELCDTCKQRLYKNPMRILDCKSPICSQIASKAPVALDYLCEECSNHFESVKSLLTQTGIDFTVNPQIVRGLDYYTKTVFEFVHEGAGAQGVVCGGGRYDGLVESLGGQPTPGIGFGMGIERLMIVAASEGLTFEEPKGPALFIGYIGELGERKAKDIVFQLQDKGFYAVYDINHRSLKAQMKYANKIRAKKMIVLGDNEVNSNTATIKDMFTGEENIIDIDSARLAAALG